MSEFVTIADPRPGTRVELSAGSHLTLRFRRPLGASRWQVADHPGHVVPLGADGVELHFLVFAGESQTLRLERRHPERGIVHEVCELTVVPEGAPARLAVRRSA